MATEGHTELRLSLEYEGERQRYSLTLLFDEVRQLIPPEISSSLFVPELEIDDVRDRMLEGISFEIISHFDRSFRCLCRDISVVDFRPL